MITMQVRAKWVRILETAGLRSTSGMGAAGGLAASDGAAAAGGAQFGNAGRGRGRSGNTAGGGVSGQPAGGAARGAFSGRGGRGGGTAGRRSRVNPRPAFPAATAANGLGTCHKFNGSRGCDRIQIDATTCEVPREPWQAAGRPLSHRHTIATKILFLYVFNYLLVSCGCEQ
jgi:hypothetical protein